MIDIIKNSKLYFNLTALLLDERIDFVSFDIFDTLLRRTCKLPKLVFKKVARNAINEKVLIGFKVDDYVKLRIKAEVLARHKSIHEDITFNDIFNEMDLPAKTKKRLKELELLTETDVLYPDPIAWKLVELAHSYNKKLILISDMYLPKEFLETTISKNNPTNCRFEHVFVSSEDHVSKATGNLFKLVITKLKTTPEKILHIGDNYNSDILSAQSNRILTIYYEQPKWLIDARIREASLEVNLNIEIEHARTYAALILPYNLSKQQEFFYLFGAAILGPFLVGFAHWINNNIESLDTVFIENQWQSENILTDCLHDISSNMIEQQANQQTKKFSKLVPLTTALLGISLDKIDSTKLKIQKLNTRKSNPLLLLYSTKLQCDEPTQKNIFSFLPFNNDIANEIETIDRSSKLIDLLINLEKNNSISKSLNIGVKTYLKITQLTNCEAKNQINSRAITKLLYRSIQIPTLEEAQNLGGLNCNLDNGSKAVDNLINAKSIEAIQSLGIESFWYNSCLKSKEEPIWPQGVITQVSPMYISNTLHCDMSDRKHDYLINKLIEQLKTNEIKEVIVYGAGEFFYQLSPHLSKIGVNIKNVVDSKAENGDFKVAQYNVTSLFTINRKSKTPFIIASGSYITDIKNKIISYMGNNIVIISSF